MGPPSYMQPVVDRNVVITNVFFSKVYCILMQTVQACSTHGSHCAVSPVRNAQAKTPLA